MEPVRTTFTDSFNVQCPHCGALMTIDVTRERGGKVTNVAFGVCANAQTDRLLESSSNGGTPTWLADSQSIPVAKSSR